MSVFGWRVLLLAFAAAAQGACHGPTDGEVARTTHAVESDLLAYEPFDGPAGALHGLADGLGWSNPFEEYSGDVSVPGYNIAVNDPPQHPLLARSGNYAVGGWNWDTSGRSLDVATDGPFASYLNERGRIGAPGTTLWVSALLRKDDDWPDEDKMVLHSGSSGGAFDDPTLSLGYFGSSSEQDGVRFWSVRIGSSAPALSSVPIVTGEAALLVAKIEFGATTTVTLFVNPSSLAGAAPTGSSVQVSSSSTVEFAHVGWHPGTAVGQGAADEIRVGRTYASVTPVTGTASCTDNLKDSDESDIDCGGSCAPAKRCATNQWCTVDGDCASGSCLAGVCVAASGSGGTAPFAIESFGGDPSALFDRAGGSGWLGPWVVGNASEGSPQPDYAVVDTSLSFGALEFTGGHATGGSFWNTAGRSFDVRAGGPFRALVSNGKIGRTGTSVWVSALLRKDADWDDEDAIYLHAAGNPASLSDPALSIGYFGSASNVAGTRYWGIRLGSSDVRVSDVPVVVGETALLVARIDFGATNTVRLFVNPVAMGGAAPAAAAITASTSASLAFSQLGWYPGNNAAMASLDEIRVGPTYDSVTPVASCVGVCGGTLRVDLRRTSIGQFYVSGSNGWLPTHDGAGIPIVQGINVAAGTHTIDYGGGAALTFQLDALGHLTVAPNLLKANGGFVTVQDGTPATLVIDGFDVVVDGSELGAIRGSKVLTMGHALTGFVGSTSDFPVISTLRLPAMANVGVQFGSGQSPTLGFSVDATGAVAFTNPQFDDWADIVVSGSGPSRRHTVLMHGRPIQISAAALDTTGFLFGAAFGPNGDWLGTQPGKIERLQLPPMQLGFQFAAGVCCSFTLDLSQDGHLSFTNQPGVTTTPYAHLGPYTPTDGTAIANAELVIDGVEVKFTNRSSSRVNGHFIGVVGDPRTTIDFMAEPFPKRRLPPMPLGGATFFYGAANAYRSISIGFDGTIGTVAGSELDLHPYPTDPTHHTVEFDGVDFTVDARGLGTGTWSIEGVTGVQGKPLATKGDLVLPPARWTFLSAALTHPIAFDLTRSGGTGPAAITLVNQQTNDCVEVLGANLVIHCDPGANVAWIPCDDGNACTENDHVIQGQCAGDRAAPEATSCSDGNSCNGAEYCDGFGTCKPGIPDTVTGDLCTDGCGAGRCAIDSNGQGVCAVDSVDSLCALTPTVCRIDRGAGAFTAVFGYANPTNRNLPLPTGASNAVSPAPADHGQPTLFKAGGDPAAFTAESAGEAVSWSLGNTTVQATAASPPCDVVSTAEGEGIRVGGAIFTFRYDQGKIAAGAIGQGGASAGLAGSTSVDPNGQLAWTMPIDVPAGRNGMQPSLAVTYSSGSMHSGPLGVGFALQGLSQIQRCKLNFRQDPTITAVEQVHWTLDGQFCLDGARLVEVEQPPALPTGLPSSISLGSSPREYRTERDSYSRIFRVNSTDARVPERWVVVAKGGRIMDYGPGVVPNEGCPNCVPLGWPLTRVSDRFGNTVTYEYEDRGDGPVYEPVVTAIRYTGGNGRQPLRSLVFVWEPKSAADQDVVSVDTVAFGFTQRVRLVNIVAPDPVAPATIRSYFFSYEGSPRTGRTRLHSISEQTAAGDPVRPPVVFNWEDGEAGFDRSSTGITDAVSTKSNGELDVNSAELRAGITPADLDGDGFDDLIYNVPGVSFASESDVTAYYVFNDGSGLQFFRPLTSAEKANRTIHMFQRPFAYATANPVDLDGDGIPELSVTERQFVNPYGVNIEAVGYSVMEMTRDGSRKYVPSTKFPWANAKARYGRPRDIRFVDMNGDGLVDIIKDEIVGTDVSYQSYINRPSLGPSGTSFSHVDIPLIPLDQPQYLRLPDPTGAGRPVLEAGGKDDERLDLDGDGVSDFVTATIGNLATNRSVTFPFAAPPGSRRLGDINGDGRPDMFALDSDKVLVQSSSGFSDVSESNPIPPGTPASGSARLGTRRVRVCSYPHCGAATITYCAHQVDNPSCEITDIQGSNACPNGCRINEESTPSLPCTACGPETFNFACNVGVSPCNDVDLLVTDTALPDGYALSRTLDLNGDGLTDFVQVEVTPATANTVPKIYDIVTYLKKGKKPDMLTGITTGDGASTRVEYSHMGDRSGPSDSAEVLRHPNPFYTPGHTGCAYPFRCDNRARWMVKRLISDTGQESIGGAARTNVAVSEYSYEDGRTDLRGRGFLGFAHVMRSDSTWTDYPTGAWRRVARQDSKYERFTEESFGSFPFSGIATDVTRTTFDVDKTYVSRTYLGSRGDGVSVSTGVPETPSGTNSRVYRVNVNDTFTDEYEAPSTVSPMAGTLVRRSERLRAFDLYGNADYETTYVSAGEGDHRSTVVVTNLFPNDGTNALARFLGMPQSTTVQQWFKNGGELEYKSSQRKTAFAWNLTTAALDGTTIQPEGNVDERLTTTYVRNPDGLVAEEHRTGVGTDAALVDRVTRTSYDELEGMYPAVVRNPAGHESRFVYHPAVDAPVWSRDANGSVTRFAYDRFGDVLSTTGALSSGATSSLVREGGALKRITTVSGGGEKQERYDRLHRVVETLTRNADGSYASSHVLYDELGRVSVDVGVYETVATTYDALSRPTRLETYATPAYLTGFGLVQRTISIDHPTLLRDQYHETVATTLTKSKAVARDVLGQVVLQEELLAKPGQGDGELVTTSYRFGPFGLPISMTQAGNSTVMDYDDLGRRRSLTSPDAGNTLTRYDAFGEIRWSQDAALRVTQLRTDALGRITKRFDEEPGTSEVKTTTFEYDTAPDGVGQLAWARSPDGVTTVNAYDVVFHAPNVQHLYVGSEASLETRQTYDEFGRVDTVTYPETPGQSRFGVKYTYSDHDGSVDSLVRAGTQSLLWKAVDREPLGRPTFERFGNGAERVSIYDPGSGRVTNIRTSLDGGAPVQDLTYIYRKDGQLKRQDDGVLGRAEGFSYDSMDRLWTWHQPDDYGDPVANGWKVAYDIDAIGNLKARTTTGTGVPNENVTYAYDRTGGAGPHAVTSTSLWTGTIQYDPTGNVKSHPTVGTISYTAFDLPKRITRPDGGEVTYLYDAFGTRVRKQPSGTGSMVTTYVGSIYERRTVGSDAVHVLNVDGVAQIVRSGSSERISYFSADRLGTPDVVMNVDETGNTTISRQKRDPFGNDVTPRTGVSFDPRLGSAPLNAPSQSSVTVGFTGHEQEDDLGVVNMRGRIYDPRLGSMLQADVLLTVNLYAYASSDPVNRVDATGFDDDRCDQKNWEGNSAPSSSPGEGNRWCYRGNNTWTAERDPEQIKWASDQTVERGTSQTVFGGGGGGLTGGAGSGAEGASGSSSTEGRHGRDPIDALVAFAAALHGRLDSWARDLIDSSREASEAYTRGDQEGLKNASGQIIRALPAPLIGSAGGPLRGLAGVLEDLGVTRGLNPQQAANLARFTKRLPAGAGPTSVHELPGGGRAFQAQVPGRVPGSRAIYEKQVGAGGETLQVTKTSFDPAGGLIHSKDKITGEVVLP